MPVFASGVTTVTSPTQTVIGTLGIDEYRTTARRCGRLSLDTSIIVTYRFSITTFLDKGNHMSNESVKVDREDRVGLFITIGVATLVAISALASGIVRILKVAPGEDVPIRVNLEGHNAMLDLGSGAVASARLETGIVEVARLRPSTVAVSLAEPIISTLAILAGTAIVTIVLLRLIRGIALAKRTHLLVFALAVITLVAGLAGEILADVASNSALVDMGGEENLNLSVSLIPVLASLAIAAVGVAFESAHRLHKDTEGLV